MLEVNDLYKLIHIMIDNKLLEIKTVNYGFQVIARTPKGNSELVKREFSFDLKSIQKKEYSHQKKMYFDFDKVNEKDKTLFKQFDFFLEKFNDQQKKAIISDNKNILCVAGAGSGKTTVLTKRIEFLNKFKSVSENKILAITFTRKAKEEMKQRLNSLNLKDVRVETFNSFCEKLLRQNSNLIYGDKDVRVVSYKDKISIVRKVVEETSFDFEEIIDDYFNKRQIREKSKEDLFFLFVNDIFTIIDFYKNIENDIKPFYEKESEPKKKRISKSLYDISIKVDSHLKKRGLRDFSDQIVDVVNNFDNLKEIIPQFDHVLVDEFQDLNMIQHKFLKLLESENLFVVGDPRQAIYGWRGSDVNYILNFPKEYESSQVLSLHKNYRSTPQIVNLFNKSVESMNLEDLEPVREDTGKKDIFLIEQDNEELEKVFVSEAIKNSKSPRNEIFVLARTNRVLSNFADFFDKYGIPFAIKSEEEYKDVDEVKKEQITLATVHSIKGMEAEEVYLVSANTLSFPNKVQDNFVLSNVKDDFDYNKFDEELRLFYVALSRAKSKLVITYTGNYSKFITDDMLSLIDFKQKNNSLFKYADSTENNNLINSNSTVLKNMLKDWRLDKSNQTSIPSYMIISNSTIDEVVRLKPKTKDDLLNISGFGPTKVMKYGEDILRIING